MESIMEITFAGTQAETDTERDFFRFLVREGIQCGLKATDKRSVIVLCQLRRSWTPSAKIVPVG